MKLIALFASLAFSLAASDSKSATMMVTFAPKAVVSLKGTQSVEVKIRLSQTARAQLWIGDTCLVPAAGSYIIAQSGTYEVPLSLLAGSGRMACLFSAADGLMEMVPLLAPRVTNPVRCVNSTCSSI